MRMFSQEAEGRAQKLVAVQLVVLASDPLAGAAPDLCGERHPGE